MGQNVIEFINEKTINIVNENHTYTLDKIYTPDTSQEDIFQQIAEVLIKDFLQGYNGTIFTYGVTGSGKTHTMFGNINDEYQKGIIPRMSDFLIHQVDQLNDQIEFIVKCSMLEIYKEVLYDSLSLEKNIDLKIKETPKGIIVQGLSQKIITDAKDIMKIIEYGYNTKQTRTTRLNEYSSRSHTIFIVEITQRLANESEKVGRLNLIDLAGCEKVSKSETVGDGLEEAIKINLSLTCLEKVIHSLTNNQVHIPYKDSKLTRILQESLGGNYKTSLIVTCSMHSRFLHETISSLMFANRAKTIKNQCKINVKQSAESIKQAMEELQTEIKTIKNLMFQIQNNILEARADLDLLPLQGNEKLNKIS
ncbi:kinesin motor domain protein, partial [Ichthyophthirius multifiliis]